MTTPSKKLTREEQVALIKTMRLRGDPETASTERLSHLDYAFEKLEFPQMLALLAAWNPDLLMHMLSCLEQPG